MHHEITHAKQFKALRENNFYNEDKIRLNFKNFITFNMICEADAYSSEARFVSKNKDKIGTLPNYCASFFNKSFGKNNDEKQAYNETFEWLIQDVKSPLKNYNWFLREIYLGNDKRSSIDIKEDDFIKLLDNSFEMKVDKKLIDNIVKNFKIPQDGWHKLSEESVKVGDFSFKEFPLIDFDNKEALDYMKYIVNERKDAEKIKSIIDLYKENDVVPTKEGVLYKELNKWIKSQPKEDKDALRLSNMVDTVESRISFSYNNDIAPLRTKDVEFSKTIPKNLISNNKDVLIKSKKGRSL
ncbi:MAG: hypothetical protein BWY78_01102 [Alphaproteobacteria bacterium ADurb.Bin438]|nr:MAG: hypothetical protein BWY78_01102 [Alphaproteobacteria bacterium ADurb.Bin438]